MRTPSKSDLGYPQTSRPERKAAKERGRKQFGPTTALYLDVFYTYTCLGMQCSYSYINVLCT